MAFYLTKLLRAGGRPLVGDTDVAPQFEPRVMSIVAPPATREPLARTTKGTRPMVAPQAFDPGQDVPPADTAADGGIVAESDFSGMVPPPARTTETVPVAEVVEPVQSKRRTFTEPRAEVPVTPPPQAIAVSKLSAHDVPSPSEMIVAVAGRAGEGPVPALRKIEIEHTQTSSAPAERGVGRPDLWPHEHSKPPVAPRVEFIAEERIVGVLEGRSPVHGPVDSRRAVPPLPGAGQPSRSEALVGSLHDAEIPVASSRIAPMPAQSPPMQDAGTRRNSAAVKSGQAEMQVSAAMLQTQRRDVESTIQIKGIDIHVVSEEKGKTPRAPRTIQPAEEKMGARFDRQYVREVL